MATLTKKLLIRKGAEDPEVALARAREAIDKLPSPIKSGNTLYPAWKNFIIAVVLRIGKEKQLDGYALVTTYLSTTRKPERQNQGSFEAKPPLDTIVESEVTDNFSVAFTKEQPDEMAEMATIKADEAWQSMNTDRVSSHTLYQFRNFIECLAYAIYSDGLFQGCTGEVAIIVEPKGLKRPGIVFYMSSTHGPPDEKKFLEAIYKFWKQVFRAGRKKYGDEAILNSVVLVLRETDAAKVVEDKKYLGKLDLSMCLAGQTGRRVSLGELAVGTGEQSAPVVGS
ncbi:Uu.00g023510.m01.CDS01 [Anthostomella pinea]|uniref:Uu.00g023510.m01.CDS01 n=1 Tax=Anthostomella pinea TaxID=933095 RepID=A0AAI8W014_9PEZI|nr:Uu.00g023510.m01.CDS01 [Anthostomella pinea]